jgi:hypothetical protein
MNFFMATSAVPPDAAIDQADILIISSKLARDLFRDGD